MALRMQFFIDKIRLGLNSRLKFYLNSYFTKENLRLKKI